MIYLSLSPILGGVDVIGHGLSYHKLMGIEKTLSSVMGLTLVLVLRALPIWAINCTKSKKL